MKIDVKREELCRAISIVQRGVNTNSNFSILNGILIETINGRLKLVGSNLDLRIEIIINCNVIEEGSRVVESKLLGGIVRSLYDDNVQICSEGNSLKILSGNSFFYINSKESSEYPMLPIEKENNSIEIGSEVFKNMIKQTAFATAQGDITSILSGALLEILDNQISLISLDRYRLAVKRERIEGENSKNVIIPAKTLNELSKIIDIESEVIKIFFSKNYIKFNIGEIVVTSILLEGEYVDYNKFLDNDFNSKITLNKKLFQDSIERAILLNKDQGASLVTLEIKDEKMIIKSESQVGNFEDILNIELQGSYLLIGFNAKYLLEGLKVIDSENINIYFTSKVGPCIIKPENDYTYTYLVLPTRSVRNS